MTNEETIDHLNGLIEVCKDGEQGYLEAAKTVHNSQVTTIFNEYAKQRAHFARDLQTEVERLGGSPPDHGSLTAALHRGWMDLKSVLSGGDAGAIIAACETGEDSAQAAFERVVNTDISGHSRSLVEKQWQKIQEAHKHMLRLKAEGASGAEFPKNE
ncbi:MAG: ferritin-like domain-containing protein [Bryobacteraceae bacterium]